MMAEPPDLVPGMDPGGDPVQRARQLALRFGWNATSYQILNPGIDLWFSRSNEAVAGYVDHGRIRVVAGAPVCSRESVPEVVRELEADTVGGGRRVCFFGAETRLTEALRGETGHAVILLGAQPSWNPKGWQEIISHRASLRAQLNRARNKGVAVTEIGASEAQKRTDLHQCLEAWLATRGLPSMHFLVESETLQRLFDRRIFVATQAGRVVGFAVASPITQRNGWLVEQIVRRPNAPNGTSESLVDAVARTLAQEKYDYLTLGLAPLSRRAVDPAVQNPFWLRLIFFAVRAHGRRFYNFDGLDKFKSKFHPDLWEPIYAVSHEKRFSFSTLYAIASVFSDGAAPVMSVVRAMGRGLKTEWGRILRFGRERHRS